MDNAVTLTLWIAAADFIVVLLILIVEIIDVARHWKDARRNGR